MYKFISMLALLFATQSNIAYAGEQSGKVLNLIVRSSDGMIYFEMENKATGKPACATHSYWIIADEKSTTGKQQMAMLLAARVSGQVISVYGTNTCTRWSDGEDVSGIIF
ncbi:hypothetical protein [Janthinobacterium sp. 1_2014MBL_MicDiv]|uniref:hypothetical protein n=1 Tax=Janthinobacterium sp. 1_2014MBL_MicDiv TaxID=1644131 RepID=UPI0008F4F3A3|nr:hypothetical protein [Janthinobacterium sp. 1_2014MBL_MicDiv]APA67322.1 hypothetical protein YQ44_05145 [Janthinobacterium sp. 1_2014MBL_MicDiv]